MKTDIKQKIIDVIIEKMEDTKLPPWDNGFLSCNEQPVNLVSGKAYRGVNDFVLRAFGGGTNEFVTFKQATTLGGKVKKGEKGLPVVWYTPWNTTKHCASSADVDEDTDVVIPLLRYSTVFNISQCEGVTGKRKLVNHKKPAKAIEKIENWFEQFKTNTELIVEHNQGTACYQPLAHMISIRNIDEFKSVSAYYAALFHESVHSTGKALGRKIISKFASRAYSAEEVVAEMGALFLCQHFGIEKENAENSAAYIKSWGKHLKENPDWLFHGITRAEKAYNYMLEQGGETE